MRRVDSSLYQLAINNLSPRVLRGEELWEKNLIIEGKNYRTH